MGTPTPHVKPITIAAISSTAKASTKKDKLKSLDTTGADSLSPSTCAAPKPRKSGKTVVQGSRQSSTESADPLDLIANDVEQVETDVKPEEPAPKRVEADFGQVGVDVGQVGGDEQRKRYHPGPCESIRARSPKTSPEKPRLPSASASHTDEPTPDHGVSSMACAQVLGIRNQRVIRTPVLPEKDARELNHKHSYTYEEVCLTYLQRRVDGLC